MTTADPPTPVPTAGPAGGITKSSVWLRPEPSRPRRPPPLTIERIVVAAVALLDEHGVEGLTMRRLAERLDVTATAVYWHVKTKDDVLDLAVDRIFGDVPIPQASDDWQADIRALVGAWRVAMLRHRWAPRLIGRPMLGPNVLSRTEFLQAALVRGGFRGLHLAVATRTLANYVIGAALTEATWHRAADPRAKAAVRDHIVASANDYPTLHDSGHLDDTRWSDELLFEEGLNHILSTTTGPKSHDDRDDPR